MLFFPGWNQPNCGKSGTRDFLRVCISYNRIEHRKSTFPVKDWLLDCGFTRLLNGKPYPSTKKYASTIYKWALNSKLVGGSLVGASTQDYPCFDEVIDFTKLDVPAHQRLTIHRYHKIKKHLKDIHLEAMVELHASFMEYADEECDYELLDIYDQVCEEFDERDLPYVIPILQGKTAADYNCHLSQYGDTIQQNAWVGVGGLKRRPNSEVFSILTSIKMQRPDIKLHGYGLSKRQLDDNLIIGLLFSADSASGQLSGSKGSKYQNSRDPAISIAYAQNIDELTIQTNIFNCYA